MEFSRGLSPVTRKRCFVRATGRQIWHNLPHGPSFPYCSRRREIRSPTRDAVLRLPRPRHGTCLSSGKLDLPLRLELVLPPDGSATLHRQWETGRRVPGRTVSDLIAVANALGRRVGRRTPCQKRSMSKGVFPSSRLRKNPSRLDARVFLPIAALQSLAVLKYSGGLAPCARRKSTHLARSGVFPQPARSGGRSTSSRNGTPESRCCLRRGPRSTAMSSRDQSDLRSV